MPTVSVPFRPEPRRFELLAPGGVVTLECLDESGGAWYGEAGARTSLGSLEVVLRECLPPETEAAYMQAVLTAAAGDIAGSAWRSQMLVIRGEGTRFHASPCENRESIKRHGLDWRRMSEWGIAGSQHPEWPGVFLCDDLYSAEWFARMRVPADIWTVRVDGLWLVGDPGSDGGGSDDWMISLTAIEPERVELHAPAT